MSILQDIYNSEINFRVQTMWDGGFEVDLGDEINGFKESTTVNRWGEVEPWLMAAVLKHYPDSLFANMYRDGEHGWLTTTKRFEAAIACYSTPQPDADTGDKGGRDVA